MKPKEVNEIGRNNERTGETGRNIRNKKELKNRKELWTQEGAKKQEGT